MSLHKYISFMNPEMDVATTDGPFKGRGQGKLDRQ